MCAGGLTPSDFFPAGQQFYSASSGTSHSAPAVAGGAALIRQHFINNGLTPPSPAMTKALLVNSARHMTGALANDTLPSNRQGMGMMNLDAYFSQLAGPRVLLDQRPGNLFTASGQMHTIAGTVADAGQPFRVTLAWTDTAGPTFGNAYVNDLDLEVTAGGNTYRGNVFTGATSTTGGTADPRNNVESVFLPAGLSGPFSVRVVATNIAGDGVPGVGGALDQDYALVISNAAPVAQPVVVAGAATVLADSCGSGDGACDPGRRRRRRSACRTPARPTPRTPWPRSSPRAGSRARAARRATASSWRAPRPCAAASPSSWGPSPVGPPSRRRHRSRTGRRIWAPSPGPSRPARRTSSSAEDFDGVAAPALPSGWTSVSEYGVDAWTTVGANPDTAPNAAFINDPATVSLTSLVTPDIAVPATLDPVVLTFRHAYDMEASSTYGYDGGVLEIKIGGGYFQDILAAGGSFAAGGYTKTLMTPYGSPLPGRQAWSGSSGTYVTTIVNLPASVSGQTIRLRWRRGADQSRGGTGWRVDTISLHAGRTCCTPPALWIDDASAVEGNDGTTAATFAVRLSSASGQTVSVSYATADGTATTADGDYVAAAGTLTFDPGVTMLPVSVTVNGDDRYEADETFTVGLSGAANAPVADGQGLGTIINDDGVALSISKSGAGAGTVTSSPVGIDCGATCGYIFGLDTVVTLTATPAVESTFTGWSGGGCAGTGPCVVTMDAAKTLTATFETAFQWTETSTTYAAEARYWHTAVWTGSKMIVWGGSGSPDEVNTGGIYDPATDAWTATSTTNAPMHRRKHTAVWTGSKMIVWGGTDASGEARATGGAYEPATDSWTATSATNAPLRRYSHTAVWTGSKMIVWGGLSASGTGLNTGGVYDPVSDTWTATSATNAPTGSESNHAAWTGSKMIVWAGTGGGIYDPATDAWAAMSTINAPTASDRYTAVWTGSQMVVWGGGYFLTTGGVYDLATDTWTATSTTSAPTGRHSHSAVWTGSRMIVWGGTNAYQSYLVTGGAYDPTTDTWTATSTANAPPPRFLHTAVWTGSKMIVWGGGTQALLDITPFDTGGLYDPSPSLSIDDVSIEEGNAGMQTATFTVTLSTARGQAVSVSYATADGTATTADGDYVAASGTLTFDPGVTTLPVSVTVIGDAEIEPDETFTLNLRNPVNAPMADSQGVGTIEDDDTPPTCTSFSISPTSVRPDYQAGSQLVTITGLPAVARR